MCNMITVLCLHKLQRKGYFSRWTLLTGRRAPCVYEASGKEAQVVIMRELPTFN